MTLGAAIAALQPALAGTYAKKSGEEKKTEEEVGTITGIEIARSNGAYLGLALENGKFKLSFYDEKKKPVPVDVVRATARWDPKYKVGQEHAVLNPSADGMALESPKYVRPPFNFKIYIALLKEKEEDNEFYIVDAASLAGS